jgi:hypothetical protein
MAQPLRLEFAGTVCHGILRKGRLVFWYTDLIRWVCLLRGYRVKMLEC